MKLTSRCSAFVAPLIGAALVAGCGGGGDPLGNPATVSNPVAVGAGGTGNSLSFAYFQKCIEPIFLEQLPITQNGVSSTNTCSGAGCHDSNTGTGGALRVIVAAQPVSLPVLSADAPEPSASDVATIRTTDMYKNFYSAQGVTIPGSPIQSKLFDKPLLLNVLHGGGQIFPTQTDPHVQLISYWISHPVPSGQDEFSFSAYSMFTPADPVTGTCNTQ